MAKDAGPRERLLTASRVQTATWGVLIIWVGIMMASEFDNRNEGIGLTVLGAIFLISGVLQRIQIRTQGGGFIIAGTTMLLLGINDLLDQNLSVGAIAVILIGVGVLASAFWKPAQAKRRAREKDAGSDGETPA